MDEGCVARTVLAVVVVPYPGLTPWANVFRASGAGIFVGRVLQKSADPPPALGIFMGTRTQGSRAGLTCGAPPALRRKREPSFEGTSGWLGTLDMMNDWCIAYP